MLLPLKKIKHVNSINHEGKVVIIVCDLDGQLFYSVRQEGHEDNFDKTALKGWEDWELLPIPDQRTDESVRNMEKTELSDKDGKPILKSVFETINTTAVAPVQLISGMGHLYVFRQQKSGFLAVDRFVLDGMTNKLVPKLQVRYKRSKQRYQPLRKDKTGREVMDSYDFRDANNIPFLEPSTELSILPPTKDGWFSVVLLPTKEADQFRWHIFIYNPENTKLEIWSLASSENGLFDIRDRGGKPGILKREIELDGGVEITNAPAATKYDVQFERMTEAGAQLLRDKIKVMLVVPTNKEGMALAINFSVDTDGYLSQIGTDENSLSLNSYTRQILLPINSLDDITGIAQNAKAGAIDAIYKGEDDEVWIETDPAGLPKMGDEVAVIGTIDFNGLHKVLDQTKNTITIEANVNKLGNESQKLGQWNQKLDPGKSLLFDGMVTAYRKMSGNTLRITSPNHGLKKGDQIQLIGSDDFNGEFGVQDVKKDAFSIDMKWNNSQIVDIRLKSKPRRGIHFDAVGDAVKTPVLPLSNPTAGVSNGRTVSAWVYPEDLNAGTQFIAGNEHGLLQLLLIDGVMHAAFNINKLGTEEVETIMIRDKEAMKPEWTHYAASFNYNAQTQSTQLFLYQDGAVVAESEIFGHPRIKSAYYLDASPHSGLMVQNKLLDLGQSDFTLEAWIKTKKGGTVISKSEYENNSNFKRLHVNAVGKVVFNTGQVEQLVSEKVVNDDTWHHIALTANRQKNELSFYIDGEFEKTTSLPEMEEDAPQSLFYLGRTWGHLTEDPNLFEGSMDEIRIWKKARTAPEIKANIDRHMKGSQFQLLACWNFTKAFFDSIIDWKIFGDAPTHMIGYQNQVLVSENLPEKAENYAVAMHAEINAHELGIKYSPVYKRDSWEESYWLGGNEKTHLSYRNFSGKLSNVQIWDKALQEKTIRDSMYLELRGTEDGLAVYYPMGGIVENEVIDFSVHKLNGTVFGDPYYSEHTLSRSILGGEPVDFYKNDDLIAITQGATYEEQFEFRLFDANGDKVVNLDPPFQFDLWGKKSRNEEEEIRIGVDDSAENFEMLEEGWCRATCRFTAPDSIRLLRLFGLKEVQGEWKKMEVRKHRLTFYSNAISLRSKVDEVKNIKALADAGVDLGELRKLEQLYSWDLSEKEKIEGRIAKLGNTAVATLSESELRTRINKLKQDLEKADKNPLNYYCRIFANRINQFYYLSPPKDSAKGEMAITPFNNSKRPDDSNKNYWWEFRERSAGVSQNSLGQFWIYPHQYASDSSRPHILRYKEVQPYKPGDDVHYGTEVVEAKDINDQGLVAYLFDLYGYYLVYTTKDGLDSKFPEAIEIRPGMPGLWTMEVANPKTFSPSGKAKIDLIKKALEKYELELKLVIDAKKANRWKDILNELKTKNIITDGENLNKAINQFMPSAVGQQNPEEMPVLFGKDELVSRAAYLSFVKPASRLNISESCEGHLLLSYFDIQGQMRQTIFDAAADSRNATFEQWLPETIKTCLDFSGNVNSKMELKTPLALGENWTIEFWFSYPLPVTSDPNTHQGHLFISEEEPDSGNHGPSSPAMASVQNIPVGESGETLEILELGVRKLKTDELEIFLGTGYDMRQLSRGWHHMAIQGSGTGSSGTITFFIDGRRAGDDIRSTYLEKYPDDATKLEGVSFNYSGKITGIGQGVSKMAEVRIWDVALSPEEIEINSRSYLSGNEPGLVAYYPMSEGKGDEVRNHAGFYSLTKDLNAKAINTRWVPSTAPIGHPGDKAVYFDGKEYDIITKVKDHIEFKNLVLMSNECTFSIWFKNSNEITDNGTGSVTSVGFQAFELQKVNGNPVCSVNIWYNRIVIASSFRGEGQLTIYEWGGTFDSWHHLSFSIENNKMSLALDGIELFPAISTTGGIDPWASAAYHLKLGDGLRGQLADFRIWNRALSLSEINQSRYRRLLGNEEGLLLYCPLDEVTPDGKVINFILDNHGQTFRTVTVTGQIIHQMEALFTNDLPIGSDAVVVNEYPTVAFDPETNLQTAMMWRFLTTPQVDKLHLLTHKRIELLEQVWIGNGQFDPTLLGFIEGAPPVPSENLTIEEDYSDATSVALSIAKNTEYSWERTEDVFTEVDLNAKIGAGATITTGVSLGGVLTSDFEFNAQAALATNFRSGSQNSSQISSSSALNLNDSLALRGYKEENASLPNVGRRFLPKNVGYALVISSMADIFILRLKRSKKMVSYKVLPLAGVPPQVNTITFLINPGYTLNGSLDGQVGAAAADGRFYKDVPEMRLQFGSKYPASYMKLEEAIGLQSMIDQMDKEREAYYLNFNSRLVDETSLDSSVDIGGNQIKEVKEEGGADEIDKMADKGEEDAKAKKEEGEKSIDKYQAMAGSNSKAAGLAGWQTKMEKLLIKAGKANIVNSYVWDADGGLHISSESFASSITHSIGGSFSFVGSLGFELEVTAGISVGLGIAAGVGVELTMSKSESTSQAVALEVDVSGMEHRGITDHKDRPLFPGEKVDRYRFSSFFLEGNTMHFNDFFNKVVDPEWLAGNDEEARALRMINTDKPNKTWRILHRVTYVERPALMGFGKDARPLLGNENGIDLDGRLEIMDKNIKDIEANSNQLKRKIDHLEEVLQLAKEQNSTMAENLESILSFLKEKVG